MKEAQLYKASGEYSVITPKAYKYFTIDELKEILHTTKIRIKHCGHRGHDEALFVLDTAVDAKDRGVNEAMTRWFTARTYVCWVGPPDRQWVHGDALICPVDSIQGITFETLSKQVEF